MLRWLQGVARASGTWRADLMPRHATQVVRAVLASTALTTATCCTEMCEFVGSFFLHTSLSSLVGTHNIEHRYVVYCCANSSTFAMTIVRSAQPCGAMHATTVAARGLLPTTQHSAPCKSTAVRTASVLPSQTRWSTLTVHASDRPAPTTTTPASSSVTRGLDYTTHEGNSWMASLKASGAQCRGMFMQRTPSTRRQRARRPMAGWQPGLCRL